MDCKGNSNGINVLSFLSIDTKLVSFASFRPIQFLELISYYLAHIINDLPFGHNPKNFLVLAIAFPFLLCILPHLNENRK